MVYRWYNYSYWGKSKPIYNVWGAPHCTNWLFSGSMLIYVNLLVATDQYMTIDGDFLYNNAGLCWYALGTSRLDHWQISY